MKVQPGTPHASVNPRLNRASEAAADAQQLATKQGRKLPKAELKAAVEAALMLAPVAVQEAAAVVVADKAKASTFESLYFESLYKERIAEQVHRPRGQSGKPMSKTTKAGFSATLQRFVQYEQARGIALRLEALDLEFYQDFRTYMLDELGQGLNTFGKHITRLKTFPGLSLRKTCRFTGTFANLRCPKNGARSMRSAKRNCTR